MLCLPPMLILDEATSSIDTRTELMVQEAFEHLMKGRTSFIVAHRLSTIRNADEILVMKDGAIIEQGSHEELMAKADSTRISITVSLSEFLNKSKEVLPEAEEDFELFLCFGRTFMIWSAVCFIYVGILPSE